MTTIPQLRADLAKEQAARIAADQARLDALKLVAELRAELKRKPQNTVKTVTVEKPVEVIRKVPVEVVREVEVIRKVPVEVIKEIEVIRRVSEPTPCPKQANEIKALKAKVSHLQAKIDAIKEKPEKTKTITVEKPVEVIRKVPVQVVKEVEVVKKVPVEVIREVEVIKKVPVEVVREVEVIRKVPTPTPCPKQAKKISQLERRLKEAKQKATKTKVIYEPQLMYCDVKCQQQAARIAELEAMVKGAADV